MLARYLYFWVMSLIRNKARVFVFVAVYNRRSGENNVFWNRKVEALAEGLIFQTSFFYFLICILNNFSLARRHLSDGCKNWPERNSNPCFCGLLHSKVFYRKRVNRGPIPPEKKKCKSGLKEKQPFKSQMH